MNILDTLSELSKSGAVSEISQMIGADEKETQRGITASATALIAALNQQASTPAGAQGLFNLLSTRDDSAINDISGFLKNPEMLRGGLDAMKLILGNNEDAALSKIASSSRLNAGAAGRLLPILAPIILGALSKAVKVEGLDLAGMTRMLSDQQGFMRTQAPGLMGFLERIDANDDGSILDDLNRLSDRLFSRK